MGIKKISIIFLIIVVVVVGVLFYYGMFDSIKFKISEQGGEVFVYEEVIGNYAQTPEIMDKVSQSLLDSEKIFTTKGCGIYYDDPKQVEKSKLHSEIGCIVEDIDDAQLNELKQKYNVKILPVGQYVSTEFPFRGKMSVFVGITKIYPAINRFIENNKYNGSGAVTEIYDTLNSKILYRRALGN